VNEERVWAAANDGTGAAASSVSGSERAMARAWAVVGDKGGRWYTVGRGTLGAAQGAQGLEDRTLEIGTGGRYEDTGFGKVDERG